MQISKSPITGTEFPIPEQTSDTQRLDAFVGQHPGRKVVAVQGLGFVGSVTSLVVANALTSDYAVIGVDLPTAGSFWKIAGINAGEFPVTSTDPEIEILYKQAVERGNLTATWDSHAYSLADIVLVDMNLDVQKQGHEFDVDLTDFRNGIQVIAERAKERVLVLVESTVPPGTCKQVVKPVFESTFEKRGLKGEFLIGHSYERVTPGSNYVNSIRNFYRVYSGIDDASADAVQAFLQTIISVDEYPLTRLADTNATEMAKVLENSYRAMNIAFVQEWTEFAERAGVNLFEVISAIRMRPTHANIMRPGLGVGGYCLTKDPLLASWAAQTFFGAANLPQSEIAVQINDRMPEHTFSRLETTLPNGVSGKRCLLLGVSYLNDVGDTRYTPVELLYDKLVAAGATVTLHDPFVSFWEERSMPVYTSLDEVLSGTYEIIAICTAHSQYHQSDELLAHLFRQTNTVIVDTWGMLSTEHLQALRQRNTVIAIGRGDIQ